jgi:hypothetical protein
LSPRSESRGLRRARRESAVQSSYGLLPGGPPAATRPQVGDAPSSHKPSQGEATSILTPGEGNPYARRILCEAAHAASRTRGGAPWPRNSNRCSCAAGESARSSALAHKLLKTVFVLIDRGDCYRDASVDYATMSVERNAPRWMKMLRKYRYIPA